MRDLTQQEYSRKMREYGFTPAPSGVMGYWTLPSTEVEEVDVLPPKVVRSTRMVSDWNAGAGASRREKLRYMLKSWADHGMKIRDRRNDNEK